MAADRAAPARLGMRDRAQATLTVASDDGRLRFDARRPSRASASNFASDR
jgi:hypothetical protein